MKFILPRLYAASLRLFESELSAEATGFTNSGSEAIKAAKTSALKLKTISKFKAFADDAIFAKQIKQ